MLYPITIFLKEGLNKNHLLIKLFCLEWTSMSLFVILVEVLSWRCLQSYSESNFIYFPCLQNRRRCFSNYRIFPALIIKFYCGLLEEPNSKRSLLISKVPIESHYNFKRTIETLSFRANIRISLFFKPRIDTFISSG